MLIAEGAEHRERVRPEWCDAQGVLAPAFTVVIFDRAIDVLYEWVGLGTAYRLATNCATFTLETHLVREQPVAADEDVLVRNRILAIDRKRMSIVQQMFRSGSTERAALMEQLSIHVDLLRRRSAPFPEDRLRTIREAIQTLAVGPEPVGTGQAVCLAA